MAKKVRKSKARKDIVYRIQIRGEMMCKEGRNKVLKPYDRVVRMHAEDVAKGPLSVWRNHLADKLFKNKVLGYEKVKTFEIVASAREDGEPIDEIAAMNFAQLEQYVEDLDLPVKPELYRDSGELRSAIRDCEDDEEGFVKVQENLERRRGPEYEIRKRLDELNNPDEELSMEGFGQVDDDEDDEDEDDEENEDDDDADEDDEDAEESEDEQKASNRKRSTPVKPKSNEKKPSGPKGGKGNSKAKASDKKNLADNI